MKILMNFDKNLIDLLRDAHMWEYTNVNDNHSSSNKKKPMLFFTKFQWFLIFIAIMLCPNGINSDFAGYVITGLSLFIGLLFTLVVSLFDRFANVDFVRYKKSVNIDLHPLGVRIKNFFKKVIVLTLYMAIIAIVCILMLAFTMIFPILSTGVNIDDIVRDFCITLCVLLIYRTVLCYFLLDYIYIAIKLIAYFYDFMISEIDKVDLG